MAKRRASGEGSIRKRKDGRWEGRYVAGHDAEGKPIRRNVMGKSQAEVKEKLKTALAEAGAVDLSKVDTYTVGSWAEHWYRLYAWPNLRDSTRRSYEGLIRHRIVPVLGDIPLKKLKAQDIQKMYNDMRDHGRIRTGKKSKPGLSSS